MTNKDIAKKLDCIAKQRMGAETKQTEDKKTGKSSDWSRSFKSKEGEELTTLCNVFGIEKTEQLEKLFKSATSGDGDERRKILTLHSSSLLAFLCFSNIAYNHPITIDGTKYDQVMFEVKNDVIDAGLGKPSNVDILLIGEKGKKLLFLESKFTEYLSGGRAYLSEERYGEFYKSLLKKAKFNFNASKQPVRHKPDAEHGGYYTTQEYCLNNGDRTKGYLGGIKQAFSHLLGIVTGPAEKQNEGNKGSYCQTLLENASEIKFASIVFNCDNEKYEAYRQLYEGVFKDHESIIIDAIREVMKRHKIDHENILEKLKIVPDLLSYQEILFKDNYLCDKVQTFYTNISDIK